MQKAILDKSTNLPTKNEKNEKNEKTGVTTSKWQGISVILAVLCAIHCLALPVVLMAASSSVGNILQNPLIEIALLPIAFIIAGNILYKDFKIHQRSLPFIILGIAIIVGAVGIIAHIHAMLIASALIMLTAQAYNWRLHRLYCHKH